MSFLNRLGRYPLVSDFLRRLVEFNFFQTKKNICELLRQTQFDKFLDLGCGSGIFSDLVLLEKYYGIDINFDFIQFAHKKSKKKFLLTEIKNLPFKSGQIDIILINGVLHHLPDSYINATISEIDRVLKSQGKLILIEDTEELDIFNPLGKLIHKIDQGNYIRSANEYSNFFSKRYRVLKKKNYLSGFCEYVMFYLEKVN